MTDYQAKYLKYKSKYNQLKAQINLNQKGGSDMKTMYLFKANWCGHCRNFTPTWEKLQSELSNKVKFVTYDADKHKKEIKDYNINGFPTIMLQSKDKIIEYNGERHMEGLKEFIDSY
jgi:protein disulfide-isomerase-like protein